MEITFENKTGRAYQEVGYVSRRVQENAECVVPDTNDDIGRIAAVQADVLLKSKDHGGKGILVSGEARASLLYITEQQDRLSFVRLSKPFTAELELPEQNGDLLTQVSLHVQAVDARILNPRKVSVSFDLAAEMSCYRAASIPVQTIVPEEAREELHVLLEDTEVLLPNAVCEKTFALTEQFPFPEGKPEPAQLVSEQTVFAIQDCQLIGSKAIIKGSAEAHVVYLTEDADCPVQTVFSTPFSQILELGEEQMDAGSVRVCVTGSYYDLTESINGEKVLSMEVHALLQVVSRKRMQISSITDAYSNRMPMKRKADALLLEAAGQEEKQILSAAQEIQVMEDCRDVLCVLPTVSRVTLEQEKISAAVHFDIVYRAEGGLLSAVRRTIMPEAVCSTNAIRIADVRIRELKLQPDRESLSLQLELEASLTCGQSREIQRLSAVELDEEHPFRETDFPTLTLVRNEGEGLWALAKAYHSSVEAIEKENDGEAMEYGRLLLIPKCV